VRPEHQLPKSLWRHFECEMAETDQFSDLEET